LFRDPAQVLKQELGQYRLQGQRLKKVCLRMELRCLAEEKQEKEL
jgi:hypothetical protein